MALSQRSLLHFTLSTHPGVAGFVAPPGAASVISGFGEAAVAGGAAAWPGCPGVEVAAGGGGGGGAAGAAGGGGGAAGGGAPAISSAAPLVPETGGDTAAVPVGSTLDSFAEINFPAPDAKLAASFGVSGAARLIAASPEPLMTARASPTPALAATPAPIAKIAATSTPSMIALLLTSPFH